MHALHVELDLMKGALELRGLGAAGGLRLGRDVGTAAPEMLRRLMARADFGYRSTESIPSNAEMVPRRAEPGPATAEDATTDFFLAVQMGELLSEAKAELTQCSALWGTDGALRWCIHPTDRFLPIETARPGSTAEPLAFAAHESIVRWVPSVTPGTLAVDGPIRLLQLVVDTPRMSPIGLDAAADRLSNATSDLCDIEVKTVRSWDEFSRVLDEWRPNLIELNAHGTPGHLLAGGRVIAADEVAAMVSEVSASLVLCGLCHSAQWPDNQESNEHTDSMNASVTGAIVAAGVPAAVGFVGRSESLHFGPFADGFWAELLNGSSLDEAMLAGRVGMRNLAFLEQWGAVTLTTSTHESILRPALRQNWISERSPGWSERRSKMVHDVEVRFAEMGELTISGSAGESVRLVGDRIETVQIGTPRTGNGR